MKKYKVTVNGIPYEIELEELTGAVPARLRQPLRLRLRLPLPPAERR